MPKMENAGGAHNSTPNGTNRPAPKPKPIVRVMDYLAGVDPAKIPLSWKGKRSR